MDNSNFIKHNFERKLVEELEELDINRLSNLIELKYHTVTDGEKILGDVEDIKNTFIDFQKHLYQNEIRN